MRLLLFLIAGFISILVHELGHALTAKHFGKRVEIVLQAFGGYAAYSGGAPLSRKRAFMVTAAGPGIQILLGIVAFLFVLPQVFQDGFNLGRYYSLPHGVYFWMVLGMISIVWAVLNLLPILPLDGGRLVESLLGPARQKATLLVSFVSATIICILCFTLFFQPILGVFVGMFAYQSFRALQQPSYR